VEHCGDEPQHVHRCKHDRDRADDGPAPALLEDAGEDQELTRERGRERHRQGDDARRHQHRRQERTSPRHPAEPPELARERTPLDHPREQEQRRRDQAVVDHLQDGAVEAEVVGGEQAECDQAHLRERRVGDHAAQVGRAKREQRPVDEPDRRERQDRHAEVARRAGELRDRDPEEAVGRRLRDDAREHGGHLRRRLRVRVAQPPVQREERRLDGERGGEAEEDPVAPARADVDQVERPLREAVDDDRGQHQQRPSHRVEDELERGAEPARAAPHADEHVERDQHRLEEGVEQEQVLRGEDADDRAVEQEHQAHVGAHAVAPDPEGVSDRRGHHDHR
jgi:hypothetical protein